MWSAPGTGPCVRRRLSQPLPRCAASCVLPNQYQNAAHRLHSKFANYMPSLASLRHRQQPQGLRHKATQTCHWGVELYVQNDPEVGAPFVISNAAPRIYPSGSREKGLL